MLSSIKMIDSIDDNEFWEDMQHVKQYIRRTVAALDFDSEGPARYITIFTVGTMSYLVLVHVRAILTLLLILASGVSISALIISRFIPCSSTLEGEDEMDEDLMRLEFQNSNYEEMYAQFMDASGSAVVERDLSVFKQKDYHMTVEVPFFPCKKILMYYDDESNAFLYYTQIGDVAYSILNSACRKYCMEHDLVHLYNDEGDWNFMKESIWCFQGYRRISN